MPAFRNPPTAPPLQTAQQFLQAGQLPPPPQPAPDESGTVGGLSIWNYQPDARLLHQFFQTAVPSPLRNNDGPAT